MELFNIVVILYPEFCLGAIIKSAFYHLKNIAILRGLMSKHDLKKAFMPLTCPALIYIYIAYL